MNTKELENHISEIVFSSDPPRNRKPYLVIAKDFPEIRLGSLVHPVRIDYDRSDKEHRIEDQVLAQLADQQSVLGQELEWVRRLIASDTPPPSDMVWRWVMDDLNRETFKRGPHVIMLSNLQVLESFDHRNPDQEAVRRRIESTIIPFFFTDGWNSTIAQATSPVFFLDPRLRNEFQVVDLF